MTPKFERFVGYRKDQLLRYLLGLTVDRKGRVYATLHTHQSNDPVMLRFDRNGEYLEMAYPSNPKTLEALGKKIEDAIDPEEIEYVDGRPLMFKPNTWRYWIYRWGAFMKMPFRIGPDGAHGFFGVSGAASYKAAGHLKVRKGEELNRYAVMTVDDLDRFWLHFAGQPEYCATYLNRTQNAFTMDHRGWGYFAGRFYEKNVAFAYLFGDKKTIKTGGHYGYLKKAAPSGVVRGNMKKVPADTTRTKGVYKADYFEPTFEFNGSEHLEKKDWLLGTRQFVPFEGMWDLLNLDRNEPDPAYDGPNRFLEIEDLAIDEQLNIYVADGTPRRVKVYRTDGFYLGEFRDLTIEGKKRGFYDLVNVECVGKTLYILTSFRDDKTGPVCLVKTDVSEPTKPRVLWHAPLSPLSRFIAVDKWHTPNLVWVGNGNGFATVSRIEDTGAACGEVKHIGGVHDRTFLYPWSIAVDHKGRLFVHDFERSQIIRTDDECSEWVAADLPRNPEREQNSRWRRSWGEGALRTTDNEPNSLSVDPVGNRLLTCLNTGRRMKVRLPHHTKQKGFQAYDLDTLKPLDFALQPAASGRNVQRDQWKDQPAWHLDANGVVIGAVDKDGCIYVNDRSTKRTKQIKQGSINNYVGYWGEVRKYGPDGAILQDEFCLVNYAPGSVTRDSAGNTYVMDTIPGWLFDLTYYFNWGSYTRGDKPLRSQSEITYIRKFGPEGGQVDTQSELWAHRGFSGLADYHCACDSPGQLLAVDGADRIWGADIIHHWVKALDTAGNMITRVGWWGNAETVPGEDGDPSQVGFRNIYSVAAHGDSLYVSDKDLRRIAKFKMEYREKKEVALP